MPEVRQYAPDQIRTRPLDAPLQDTRIASPDVYGAGIAEGAQRGGLALLKAREEANDRIDRTESMAAVNAALRKQQARRSQYMQTKGISAAGLDEQAKKEAYEDRDEIAKEIKSPRAKEMFHQAFERIYNETQGVVVSHRDSELQKYEVETRDAHVAAVTENGLSIGTPEALTDAELNIRAARYDQSDLTGEQGQIVEQQIAADTNKLYASHIQSLLDARQYQQADLALQQYGGKLDKATRDKATKAVSEGVDRQRVTTTALSLAKETDENGNPLNEQEIRDRVTELTKDKPELTESTIDRALSERNRVVAAQSQEREEFYSASYRKIMNGTPYEEAVSPQDEDRMTPQQVDALRSRAGIGKERSPAKTINNVRATNHIRAMIDAGKVRGPDGVVHEVSEEIVYRESVARGLTAEQFDDVSKYYSDRQKPDVLTVTDVNRAMTSMNLDKLEDYANKYPDLFEQVQGMMPKGKKATDEDIRKAVSTLFAKGEVRGGGFGYGDDMTYIEAKKNGRDGEWIPDLNEQESKAITFIMDTKGLPYEPGDKNMVVQRRAKKYLTDGMPTPIGDDGLPISVTEAIYAGTIFDSLLNKPKSTPPKSKQSTNLADSDPYGGLIGYGAQ